MKILKQMKLRRLRAEARNMRSTLDRWSSEYSPPDHCCPNCATGGNYFRLCDRLDDLEDEIEAVETNPPEMPQWARDIPDKVRGLFLSALDRLEHGSGRLSGFAEDVRELLQALEDDTE